MSECACKHDGYKLFELCGLHAHSHDDVIQKLEKERDALLDGLRIVSECEGLCGGCKHYIAQLLGGKEDA
jgi:hypothetical protein